MFFDENSVWPSREPEPPPEPVTPPARAANLFLFFALLVALIPFSPVTFFLLLRYLASRF